jgi:translation initiation factor IF-3
MRLIDDKGGQIGVVSKTEALQRAEQEDKDLVLITSKTLPPIVKLIALSKFLYQENKRQKLARKGIKKNTIKDIKLSLFIGQHDLTRLIEKARTFIKTGHQVRINLPLKGRELGKRPMAFDLINRVIKDIPTANVSVPPKFQGRVLLAILSKKTGT